MRYSLIILLFSLNVGLGQTNKTDTIYYGLTDIVETKDSALSVRYVTYDSTISRYNFVEMSLLSISNDFIQSGQLKSIEPEIKDGYFKYVDEFNNRVTTFYKDNKFIDITNYKNREGKDVEAIYPNGLISDPIETVELINLIKQLSKKLDSIDPPSKRIYVRFIIENDGSTSNITLQNKIEESKKLLIISFISLHKFEPPKHNGNNVRTKIMLPVKFE